MSLFFWKRLGKTAVLTKKNTEFAQDREYSNYWSVWQKQYSKTKLKLFPCTALARWKEHFYSWHFTFYMMLLVPAVSWIQTLSFLSHSFFSIIYKEKKKKKGTAAQIKQDPVSTCTLLMLFYKTQNCLAYKQVKSRSD